MTSVIIPTYNGVKKIPNLLKALELQTNKNFEIIVVIDGSTDNTANYLKSKSFNFSSFQIIEQKNQGRSIVRNTGARAAKGDLLLFFDDDMIPTENCISEHIEHHYNYPGSIQTGGLVDKSKTNTSDIQHYKTYLSEKWNASLQKNSHKPLLRENIFLTAANFSITKKMFENLNGFDEHLTDAEDYDLAVRAFQKNIPLYYNLKAFAWHNDPITCASFIRRQRQYSYAHKKLEELKPDLYGNFPVRKTNLPQGIKKNIYKLFVSRFWINSIDHFNWLTIFPKKIRYQLYDIIITSNGVFYPDIVKL